MTANTNFLNGAGQTQTGFNPVVGEDQFRVTYNDAGFMPKNGNQAQPKSKHRKADEQMRDASTNSQRQNNNKVGNGDAATGSKTAAQMAEDAKNRTIGHYVVGKSVSLSWGTEHPH